MLNHDIEMIERMTVDLSEKATAAMNAAGIQPNVYTIFSLDELEEKTESDICNSHALGVGWLQSVTMNESAGTNNGTASTSKARGVEHLFGVILAAPIECAGQFAPTKLLSALLLGVLGQKVADDPASRTWEFVRQATVPNESSDKMRYYQQVWRLAMPIVGNLK